MTINDTIFNADLEDIIHELRLQLHINQIPYLQKDPKRSGNSLQIQCPYHGDGQERKPSAGIRMSDGMFHCFACNEIHTLPEVISHCFGYDEDLLGKEGWKWLLKNFATLKIEERKSLDLDCARSNDTTHNIYSQKYVAEEELQKYRFYHPYWEKRKITDEDIIELFDLGYDKNTKCITMPVRDGEGNTLFVARRSVRTKFFNYPEGVEKPLYGLYELSQLDKYPNEVIVCESMIDALTCWEYGKYAVALNGLGNDLQFKQLQDLPCRELVLATDNDDAGMNARSRIRKHIRNKIVTEYLLPEGKKDINDLEKCEFEALEKVF